MLLYLGIRGALITPVGPHREVQFGFLWHEIANV
jgi:hypothetical protein